LRFIKRERIHNVVWVTADVHYTAAHYYDPAHASFTEFEPFWEFVSGPLNADARDKTLTVTLRDVAGNALFDRTLVPRA
jgi:phosphodiesterase/alkaline phosphatase D-like protein